jgi:hypothetical protein
VTIDKLLDCSEWRLVQLFRALQQLEMHSKCPVQGLGIVADNIKATAFHGTFWPERTYDHVSSVPNGASDLTDVGGTITPRRQEMKDSAVMPHIVDGGL